MDNYRFPKYARLTGPDSTLMMRSAISKDGMSATYYRPCGEWGCSIKLRHYEYSSDDPYMKDRVINIVACTPREFIEDNSYCLNRNTATLYYDAIEDLRKTEPDFIDGTVSVDKHGSYTYYTPIVKFRDNIIFIRKEKFIIWTI